MSSLFCKFFHLKRFAGLLSLAACLSWIIPVTVFAVPGEDIYAQWQEVSRLRSEGQFGLAVQMLTGIIEAYADSEEIIRHAYNELVWTYVQMDEQDLVIATARQALERFPDLEVELSQFPGQINDTYDELRRQMFGELKINKPSGARVFLGDDYVGTVPYREDLLRVGQYTLSLSKSGYHDYVEVIQIQPNKTLDRDFSMDRQRGKSWWLYRIGAGVAAGTLMAFTLAGGDKTAAEPEPLPGPPPPPGP
jgi:hypothetical protein